MSGSSGDNAAMGSYAVDCTKASSAAQAFAAGRYSECAEVLGTMVEDASTALAAAPTGVRGEVLPALLADHAVAVCAAAAALQKDVARARAVLSNTLHDIESEWRERLSPASAASLAFNIALVDAALLRATPSAVLHELERGFGAVRARLGAGDTLALSDDTAVRAAVLLAGLHTHAGRPDAALDVLRLVRPLADELRALHAAPGKADAPLKPEAWEAHCAATVARVRALLRAGDTPAARDTLDRFLAALPSSSSSSSSSSGANTGTITGTGTSTGASASAGAAAATAAAAVRVVEPWRRLATAHAALLRGDEHRALELVAACKADVPRSLVLSNMACCAAHTKKHAMAAALLERALQERRRETASGGAGVGTTVFGEAWTLRTQYALGVQLLFAGRPVEAQRALEASRALMEDDPKYWVRLAECCVARHSLFEREHARDPACRTLATAVGAVVAVAPGAAFSHDVLAYGCQCCRNALLLIAQHDSNSSNSNSSNSNNNNSGNNSGGGSVMGELRTTALVELAYLSLADGDPVAAWGAAKQLFDSRSDIVRFLGHVYGAEALCRLGQPAKAIPHLSPAALADVQGAAGVLCCGSQYALGAAPENGANALKSALYVNLAIAHILTRDDVAQATQCVQQAIALHPTPRATYVHAYLELRMGNTENAIELLRRGRQLPRRPSKKH